MGHEQQRSAAGHYRLHAIYALPLEQVIANAQDLIHYEQIRLSMSGNRDPNRAYMPVE